MQLLAKLLHAVASSLSARPLTPCCASAIHWANFR